MNFSMRDFSSQKQGFLARLMDQTNHFGKVFTPKCVLSCLLFNYFISYAILQGERKERGGGSVAHAAERLTGFFLQHKITKCIISLDISVLCFLYSAQCSQVIDGNFVQVKILIIMLSPVSLLLLFYFLKFPLIITSYLDVFQQKN